MHAMVNQCTESGQDFNPAEALTAHQALHAFTMGSAYASHAEAAKGSLTPGKLADLAVLSHDPTRVDADQIGDIEVEATIVDGRLAYSKEKS
jgi:predicted amidohydrolase YtcJ